MDAQQICLLMAAVAMTYVVGFFHGAFTEREK